MADRKLCHRAELLHNPCHYYKEYTSYDFQEASQAIKHFFHQKMILYVNFLRYVEDQAISANSTLKHVDKPPVKNQYKTELFADGKFIDEQKKQYATYLQKHY